MSDQNTALIVGLIFFIFFIIMFSICLCACCCINNDSENQPSTTGVWDPVSVWMPA